MVYSNFPPIRFFRYLFSTPVFLFVWIPLSLLSCNEDPESIGIEVLPESDLIVGDGTTLTVEAYTLEYDSLRSNRKRLSPVGNYTDPVFGKVSTSFLSEFGPNSYLLFSQNAEPDSLILELFFAKDDYYGESPMTQFPDIKVYKVLQKLSDSTYTDLNPEGLYDPVPISISAPILKKYLNTDTVLRDTTIITIKLSKEYAASFMNTREDTIHEDDFKENVFGFYIKAETGANDGSVAYVNLFNENSNLVLYYHSDSNSYSANFSFNMSADISVNLVTFDRTNSDLQVINDTVHQDSVIYIQSLGGAAAYLKFPDIYDFRQKLGDTIISINKAELILPVEDNDLSSDDYSQPVQLGLKYFDSNRKKRYLTDDPFLAGYNAAGYFYGKYDQNRKAYIFNLNNFFHNYFRGTVDFNGLELFAADAVTYTDYYGSKYLEIEPNAVSVNRVVLTSGKNSNPIKVRIYYTRVP
jgi:hypothetical protein